ncbi:hypothetical protein TOT_040000176 [Theileria orientalis strain Shintoku]|uniref:Uncharacterized protein n=1 Tax=Theileria orientalis strain Shintoku TaxID=869250 RepID=J4DQ41_THEOR|nr:hypothetical protein TOT_040000176 [Theileria orientalis strain Shintoku]BAM41794.1 hypothetical protein TOT_040000176 [Theileria orientalis strain Shintoku]|eukprot:XP_009692095.1 hypothetical protein TOT_040000176 [Theileria orientalis strain Shintoku]
MTERIFKQYPKNGLEALVLLRLVDFATKLPLPTVDSESKNVKMALEYMVKPELRRSSDNSIDINKLVRNISRLKPKSSKNGICDHDYVLRSIHNINTSKMYTRYCASKGVFNGLKRVRNIAI